MEGWRRWVGVQFRGVSFHNVELYSDAPVS